MIHHGYSHTIIGKGPQGPMVYHLVGAFNLSHNQHIMHMYEHRYRFFTLIVFRAGNALTVLRCKMVQAKLK